MTETPRYADMSDCKHLNVLEKPSLQSGGGSSTSLSSTVTSTSTIETASLDSSRRLKPPLPPHSLARSKSTRNGGSNTTSTSSVCNLRELIDRLHDKSPSASHSVTTTASARPLPLSIGRLQTPPRRIFPQTYSGTSAERRMSDVFEESRRLEASPVVFDANLSFVLGCARQPVHQTLRASPSFQEARTASANLSEKIRNFLNRTDHVQEEWKAFGQQQRLHGRRTVSPSNCSDYSTLSNSAALNVDRIERQRQSSVEGRDHLLRPLGRSRSTQNILTKAFQMSKQMPPTPPLTRSNSARNSRQRSLEFNGNGFVVANGQENDTSIQEEMTINGDIDEVAFIACCYIFVGKRG